jgi:hypothetical protein
LQLHQSIIPAITSLAQLDDVAPLMSMHTTRQKASIDEAWGARHLSNPCTQTSQTITQYLPIVETIVYQQGQIPSVGAGGLKPATLAPFGWNYKPPEKHYWLIFYERKILFRLKKQAE